MKRIMGVLAMTALVAITFTASAHEQHATPGAKDSAAVTKADLPPAPAKAPTTAVAAPAPAPVAKPVSAPTSVTGEVVDAGCYLGHGERGPKHAECAKQCVAGGMPMCLLTSDGSVYLLTMNHENPDPYNKLKTMVGRKVTVTGPVMMRGGMNAVDVVSMKSMVTQARPTKRAATKS